MLIQCCIDRKLVLEILQMKRIHKMKIIEHINSINWSDTARGGTTGKKLAHYLQRMILDEDEQVRDPAMDYMVGTLSVQDGYTKIIVQFLPLLIRILKSPEVPDKSWILYLISCHHISRYKEYEFYNNLYKILEPELETFREYLVCEQPEYRELGAKVLANFTKHGELVAHWLLEQISIEDDPEVQAHLIDNLRILIARKANLSSRTLAIIQEATRPLLQTHHAEVAYTTLALQLKIEPENSPFLDELMQTLTFCAKSLSIEPIDDVLNIHIMVRLGLALEELKEPLRLRMMLAFLNAIENPRSAYSLVQDLIGTYDFIGGDYPNPNLQLSTTQVQVLQAIIDSDAFWKYEFSDRIFYKTQLQKDRDGLIQQLQAATILPD